MSAFTANSSNFVSVSVVGCCVYPVTPLININNTFVGGYPVLTNGYYGIRGNINFGCSSPCFPDILIATSGSNKNFANGLPKLRIGDSVGIMGGVVIGTPTNNICT
jgi:hypothetical protein